MVSMSKPKVKSILKKSSLNPTLISPYRENQVRPSSNHNLKRKKSVKFAPGTIGYDRESKTYKYHAIFKQDNFPPEAKNKRNPIDIFLKNQQKSEANPRIEEDASPTLTLNTYTHFTHAKRLPTDLLRKNSESLAKSRKFFSILNELKSCHEKYNAVDSTLENRDTFLIRILVLYILALDLSLAEGYFGMSLKLLLTITDTTSSMIPLYSNIFYNLNGTYRQLPEPQDMAAHMHDLIPVIYALNRISENRSQTNDSGLNIETLITKLQLELIVLTLAPIESILFRTVLETVIGTASASFELMRDLLSTSSCLWIKWINNSNLRNDYTKILKTVNINDTSILNTQKEQNSACDANNNINANINQ